MMPLCATANLPEQSVWGWALASEEGPWPPTEVALDREAQGG